MKPIRSGLPAALCALAMTASLRADEVPAYTLADCIAVGIERSLPLANARRDEKIAGATIQEVRAQAWPSLDANASYTRLDEVPSITTPDFTYTMGRFDNYSGSVELDQLLYSGGAVRAGLRAAKQYSDIARFEVDRRREMLIRDITKSFYDILYAEAAVRVAQESVRQFEEFERHSQIKYDQRTLSEFDLLSAQVKLANERPRLVSASNTLALAKSSFRNLLYLDEEDYRLSGELAFEPMETDLEALYDIGLKNRVEVLQAAAEFRLREEKLRVSKAGYLPELRAFASYNADNPGQNDPGADAWQYSWRAGARASWSLLDGGLRPAEVLTRSLEKEKAAAQMEDIRRSVRLEIKNAYLTLNDAREVVGSSAQGVALAERALDIANVRYTKGLSTYLEFTDSNLALSNARLIQNRALVSYLNAWADLRYACGTEDLPGAREDEALQPEVKP